LPSINKFLKRKKGKEKGKKEQEKKLEHEENTEKGKKMGGRLLKEENETQGKFLKGVTEKKKLEKQKKKKKLSLRKYLQYYNYKYKHQKSFFKAQFEKKKHDILKLNAVFYNEFNVPKFKNSVFFSNLLIYNKFLKKTEFLNFNTIFQNKCYITNFLYFEDMFFFVMKTKVVFINSLFDILSFSFRKIGYVDYLLLLIDNIFINYKFYILKLYTVGEYNLKYKSYEWLYFLNYKHCICFSDASPVGIKFLYTLLLLLFC
jgi:hypothetical protein